MGGMHSNPEHLRRLEEWMLSYKPEELFDENGTLIPELKELNPVGPRRMGSNAPCQWRSAAPGVEDARLPGLRH